VPGVAVSVAGAALAQIVGELTVAVGLAFMVNVPEAETEEQLVVLFVMTTL
jgi:hypothetical protein